MLSLKSILPALLFIGCSHSPVYTSNAPNTDHNARIIPVVIDQNFSSSERKGLEAAIVEWNYSLNHQIRLNIVNEHFNMDLGTIEDMRSNGFMLLKASLRYFNLNDGVLAQASAIGKGHEIFFFQEHIDEHSIRKVALHELAHLLGAYHQQDGLMKPTYDDKTYECIDQATAYQVADYHHLDPLAMNWCQ